MSHLRFRSLLRSTLALILVDVCATLPARAQSESLIVTDRPDFTESSVTIPVGSVQVEGGFTYTESGGVSETNGSELLIRWSPTRRFEFRFGAPDFVLSEGAGGVADPSLGFKVQLGPAGPWALVLTVSTSLPLGDDRLGADDPEPKAILTTGRNLGVFSLASQIAAGWDSEEERLLFGGTVVLGTGLTKRLGGFAEVALNETPGGEAAVLAHSGLTFTAAPLIQLDLHVAAGMTDTAPDWLFGAGLVLRR